MEYDINHKAQQATNSNTLLVTPVEAKPKIQFGTIEVAAVIILVLTAIVGYGFQILWHKRQRFIKASDDFRAAFDVAIHALDTIPFCDRNILNENFRSHEKAMIKFRYNLKWKKLARFNADWKQYEQYCLCRVDVPLLCFISTEVSSLDGPDDSKELDMKHRQKALDHIKRLLSYTKK